jgi:D-amino-acid dehydrogenase
MAQETDVLIIGGGSIGICCAYYLAERGLGVTVVEKGEVCSGASYGNAGLLVPSHSIPLPAPGSLTQGLKWLFDPVSPFYVKPRLDLPFLAWLWKFYRCCNPRWMRTAMPIIHEISIRSLRLYEEVIEKEDLECGFDQKGWLHLFTTKHGYNEGLAEAKIVAELGVEWQALAIEEVLDIEPTASSALVGGLFYPGDANFDPAAFVTDLAKALEKKGVNIRTSCEVLGINVSNGNVTSVETTRGKMRVRQVVLAGGALSPVAVEGLGLRLPIQGAKGYSVTLERPANCSTVPLMLSEAKIGATPLLGNGLRLAGTFELAGLDMSVSRPRVEAIQTRAREYLPELADMEVKEIWRGLRPCTPDGLPIIGRTGAYANLTIAAGHGMMGMTLGPLTGKLVSQIVCDEAPEIDLALLSPNRFN